MRPSPGSQMRGVLRVIALLLIVACTGATPLAQPLGFAVTSGPPRSVVALQTEGLDNARVIWDAGTSGEATLPTSLGATLFSVPRAATPGPHLVAIEHDGGRTTPVTFVVTGDALRIDKPRIDHIMLLDAEFSEDGIVATSLYVQGANIDVGAVVEVNGTEVATFTHRAMSNSLHGVSQDDLGYPIHHYIALAAVPAPTSTRELSVVVENLDGKKSDAVQYTLPASPAARDSDGDSLLDTSDEDPYQRDILVELDIMIGLTYAIAPTTASGLGALDGVRAMFAAAPFLNPYTTSGINLVLDVSGSVPAKDTVIFDVDGVDSSSADGTYTVAFSTLKAAHFGHKADADAWHYVIWAKRTLAGGSGESDQPWPVPAPALEPGDDAVIGLDSLAGSFQTPRSQAEILAHELGHNLGQKHGGRTDDPYNPNYLSVMSYSWALRGGLHIVDRRPRVTCLPFYYAVSGGNEPNDQLPTAINMAIGYSAGMAAPIDERKVNEVKGVCGQPVDWDRNGNRGEWTAKRIDANDNRIQDEMIEDFANWRALLFDGPKLNGTLP